MGVVERVVLVGVRMGNSASLAVSVGVVVEGVKSPLSVEVVELASSSMA